jgi:hypothetical protein
MDDLVRLGHIMARIMKADRSLVTVTRGGVHVSGSSPLTADETAMVARILTQR